MGVLILLAVVVLAFLCGRLMVMVTKQNKRIEGLELEVKSCKHMVKSIDEEWE